MNYEFTGKLTAKSDTIQVSENFKKREFVLEKTETVGQTEYTDYIKFQLTQDKCNLIDNIKGGEEIKVYFNLRGNKWEKDNKINYFTNLQVWKIEEQSNEDVANNATTENNSVDDDSGLPF